MYWVEFDPPRKCYRCKGGVYDEFWVLLELYEFGGYEFHLPVKRTRDLNSLSEHFLGHLFGSLPMIDGYVKHKKYPHGLMREAAYWLFLFYNPKAYFGLIGKKCHRRSWYPLVRMITKNNGKIARNLQGISGLGQKFPRLSSK